MVAITRIGHGYDLHRLIEGRRMILGGVEIPSEVGPLGHSDGDAVLHAVIDAMLGAAALGDIGEHFPDNDPAYRDIDSGKLLVRAREAVEEEGYAVVNVDVTVVAERPKLKDYKPLMRKKLSDLLGVAGDAVSVKAKTNEGVDAVGEGRAIACHAVVGLGKGGQG